MQVRDLIEQLQRFDPRQDVTVQFRGTARHQGSGLEVPFNKRGEVDHIKIEAGEPVIVAL